MQKTSPEANVGNFEDPNYESDSSSSSYDIQESISDKANEELNQKARDTAGKCGLKNAFVFSQEMDHIKAEIVQQQTSKKEWYIVELVEYLIEVKREGNKEIQHVNRRYSDFEWLYKEFDNKYIGIIVPPLPEKNPLLKLNVDMRARKQLFEDRLLSLKEFLRKVISHPKLRFTSELKAFLSDSEEEFQDTMEKSNISREHSDQGRISKIANTVVSGISTAVDIISGTQSKRRREKNKDDECFEQYDLFYSDQIKKLEDTIMNLSRVFESKKVQANNMVSISVLLSAMNDEENLGERMRKLQESSKVSGEAEFGNVEQLRKNVYFELMEQLKHLQMCLHVLGVRDRVLEEIYQNKLKLDALARMSGRYLDEIDKVSDVIARDQKKIDVLQILFKEDVIYFNDMIQKRIRDILFEFTRKQVEHSQSMAKIWMES